MVEVVRVGARKCKLNAIVFLYQPYRVLVNPSSHGLHPNSDLMPFYLDGANLVFGVRIMT